MTDKLKWAGVRLSEVALAALAVFLFTSRIEQQEAARFDAILPTEWFEVSEIFVPDHEVGSNPLVVYDRAIHRDFQGFWVVEVQRRDHLPGTDRFFAACSGSGTSNYETTDYIDPEMVTWEWFLGRPCAIGPGVYRLVVTYDMRIEDTDRVKRYKVLSNVFRVYEDGGVPQRGR